MGIFGGIAALFVVIVIAVIVWVKSSKKKPQQSQQAFQPIQNTSSTCLGCGKGLNAEMTFCPGCGTQCASQSIVQNNIAPSMMCQKCGSTDLHFGTTEVKQKRNAGGRFVNLIMFVATSIWAVITLAFWVLFGAASLGFGFFMMAAFYARRKKNIQKTQALCKRCGNQWILN